MSSRIVLCQFLVCHNFNLFFMRRKYLNFNVFFGRYSDHSDMTKNALDNKRKIINSVDIVLRKVVDGYGGQDFARNSHGWPMNDLALLQKANTQQELDLALSRLREVGVLKNNNEGKSVRQVLDDVLPRYVQTPAEISRYAEYYSSLYAKSDEDDVPMEKDVKEDVKKESSDKSV